MVIPYSIFCRLGETILGGVSKAKDSLDLAIVNFTFFSLEGKTENSNLEFENCVEGRDSVFLFSELLLLQVSTVFVEH
jgi:hypothetical protein